MNFRKLYLHIGPHKTGSTYLQNALNANYEILLENNKNYSILSRGKDIAHHKLAELYFLKKFDEAALISDQITKETSGDVVLSSENFDRLDLEAINVLIGHYSDFKIHVLYYSRNLPDLLVSNWQEDVKHGGILSWGDYSFEHLARPFQSSVLNKTKILDLFCLAATEECLYIHEYDQYLDSDADIYEDFLDFIGCGNVGRIDKKLQINKSMPYHRIELIRALNSYRNAEGKKPYHFVRTAFLTYLKDNPSCPEITSLEKRIKESSIRISLENSFTLSVVDKLFKDRYGKILSNKGSVDSKAKVYDLPQDCWLFFSESQESLNLIYRKIQAILDSY